MDDSISRQAAIDELYSINPTESDYIFIDEAVQRLENLPPIQERKNGKWKWSSADNGWADWTCSVCGYTKTTDIHVKLSWKYCPWCGSDLRGKEE